MKDLTREIASLRFRLYVAKLHRLFCWGVFKYSRIVIIMKTFYGGTFGEIVVVSQREKLQGASGPDVYL